ncbi:hypothetical protein [Alcanivorax sp. 1008]|uniref:hypothetical protein n=1 Tax=Alcanivorax sp. 1008 TaxID=2816853 RepID=UPI001D5CB4D7|nr:hypothetical protein [Alcanivorax sp. 1008]MCC1496774.1 hypothetical protein [Alcanivorax sp. 1008]
MSPPRYPDGIAEIEDSFPFNVTPAIEGLIESAGAPAALQPALVLACASFLKALPGHTPAIPPEAFAATIQSVWPQADDFVIENLIQGLMLIATKHGQIAD